MAKVSLNTKSIQCPFCERGKILIENLDETDFKLFIIHPPSKQKANWYVKCSMCKNQVGFTIKR